MDKMKLQLSPLIALAALAALAPALQAQVTLPESLALPANSVDRSKPGFKVRTFQGTTTLGTFDNSIIRAEAQIAGLLTKPDGTPFENIADLSSFSNGVYDEPNIISYTAGTIPGIPGSEANDDNIALEAVTYLELAAQTYTMVVNSDDGFRVTAGNIRDRVNEINLGQYDGGRGAGDTIFNFTVTKAGVYPFRLIYYEGGGGNSVDWFTADAADPAQRIHINGDGGVKAFRSLSTSPVVGPAISGIAPPAGSINVSPSTGLTALIEDGTAPLNQASFKLFRNDVEVTAAAVLTRVGTTTKVVYKPAVLPPPLSKEVYRLVFDDPTATGGKREATLQYTLAPYANFNLPTPIYFEGFDGVDQGSLPAGWSTFSPITGTGIEDLDDPNSDTYLVWVVISKQRVQDLSVRWDAARRLNFPEAFVNGVKIDGLINNQFAYHESDIRGGSQYAELISPEVNLTGKTDVYLVYNSVYEQNQDNIAGVEYSIDGGTSWLPVVYMIDTVDIVKNADGTVDPEGTLTATQNDTASYPDPNGGEDIGKSYGAFVKAPKTEWPTYAPFISGRINDDAKESKRVEKFRLAKADNQSKVKLRFFQAGTGSWYFGVDNVGLYSITTIDPPALSAQPKAATVFVSTSTAFKVGATGTGLTYQWQKNQVNIPNATTDTLTFANVARSDAGKYRAIVKNAGGEVTTDEVTLTVNELPGSAASLKTGLAVYLPFDGTLNDVSGNNRNGSAVGTPELTTGRVGTGAVRVKSSRADQNFNFVTLGSQHFGETKDFTVAYWMKTERVAGDPSVVANKNWGSGNNTGWSIGTQTDGRLELNYRRTGEDGLARKDLDLLSQGLAANEWKHVVISWSINGNVVSYIDGIEVNRIPIGPGTGTLNDPALALNIGQDGTGAYTDGEWDGLLDDFAIWERALTGEEVSTLYAFGVFGDNFNTLPVTSGLGVHLKFDGNYSDSSGNGHNGTAVGSPELTSGLSGGAVRVKSVRDPANFNYVTLGKNNLLPFGQTKDFTVGYWMKTERVTGDPAVVANKNWGSGGNVGWSIGTQTDGRLEWNYRRRDPDSTRKDLDAAGQGLEANVWNHVVVAFTIAGDAVSYVNGLEIDRRAIGPATGNIFDAALSLNIGQDGTGAYTDGEWDGLIDDLAIWDRSLSKREVATLYGQGLKGLSLDGTPGSGGTTLTAASIARNGASVVISWTGTGKLQTAPSVTGPWSNSTLASPATVAADGGAAYFRIVP